jgi:prepilin-type N-terminal cleavage/methylation domain-containing protein
MKFSRSIHKGFTLLETLVSLAIFLLIIGGSATLFKESFSGSSQKLVAIGNIDQARATIFNFANELRNASYGVDGSYPINESSDSEVIFFSNYGTSLTSPSRIRYFVATSTLYKGVTPPNGTAYNLGNEVLTAVEGGITNPVGTPLFYYYDGSYTGTTSPLVQPVNINSVKFIKMNLVVLTQDVRNGTSTFSVTGGAAIRSLKTNLGS